MQFIPDVVEDILSIISTYIEKNIALWSPTELNRQILLILREILSLQELPAQHSEIIVSGLLQFVYNGIIRYVFLVLPY